MGFYTPDVYYQPEKFDLTPVAELEFSDGFYQFDLRVVWSHPELGLLTARDSGCSCPSPFEEYTDLSHLSQVDYAALETEITEHRASDYSGAYPTEEDADRFLSKVRNAL
jgi:hypothetical protein